MMNLTRHQAQHRNAIIKRNTCKIGGFLMKTTTLKEVSGKFLNPSI